MLPLLVKGGTKKHKKGAGQRLSLSLPLKKTAAQVIIGEIQFLFQL